jgi:hypothetical protein
VLASLCLNVAQALSRDESDGVDNGIAVRAYASGTGRHLTYSLEVHDHLPFMVDWCPAGQSLTTLRTMLRQQYDGDLCQRVVSDGTKAIVATWADRTPEIEVGTVFESRTRE